MPKNGVIKFMFFKKATKSEEIVTVASIRHYLTNVKLMVKISSVFVAFLENMNFNYLILILMIVMKETPLPGRIFFSKSLIWDFLVALILAKSQILIY